MTIDPLSIFQQRVPLSAAADAADLARLRETERLTLLARLDEQDGLIADLTIRFDDLETEQASIAGALDELAAIVMRLAAPKGTSPSRSDGLASQDAPLPSATRPRLASGPVSALGKANAKEDGPDEDKDVHLELSRQLERSRQNAQRRWRQFRL